MATLPQPGSPRVSARLEAGGAASKADVSLIAAAEPGATEHKRHKSRGQSLAEFSLTVPMALLMILFGLDFGRVFLGWVALNSAAREAANYAAMNPTAWTLPYNLDVQDEYTRLVQTEASNINCTLMSPIASPTFPSGTGIGAPASVVLTCQFSLITPFIALITGNPIPVSASSAFPVRAGLIESVPIETPSPAPTSSPTPTATAAPTDTPAPTPTPTAAPPGVTPPPPTPTPAPTPTPSPTPSPTPAQCTVVSLLNTQTNKAAAKWLAAGFKGSIIFSPLVPPNYKIAWQSLTVGTTVVCTSGIQVRSSAP
jgi:hypothetical protein